MSKSQVKSELLKLQFQGRSHALMTDKWLNLDSNRYERHDQCWFQIKNGFWRRQDAKVDLESRHHILICDFIAVKSSRVRSPTHLATQIKHFHTLLLKNITLQWKLRHLTLQHANINHVGYCHREHCNTLKLIFHCECFEHKARFGVLAVKKLQWYLFPYEKNKFYVQLYTSKAEK